MTVRRWLALLLCCVLVAGCTSSNENPTGAPASTIEALSTIGGPAAEHARWVIGDALADRPETAALDQRFSPALLDGDASSLHATLDAVRATGPWDVATARSSGSGHTADVVLRSARGQHLLLHTTVDASGRAIVFWFGNAVNPALDAADPAELERILSDVPAQSGIAIGRVDGDRCVDVETAGTHDGSALPLASVSKLLLLDAVLGQIETGALSWSQTMELTETSRSLPAGALAQAPSGTRVTVGDAVRALLVESDNTAADLLLTAVGAEHVDSVYQELSTPGPTHRFWSTREVFELGWGSRRLNGDAASAPAVLDALRREISASALTATVVDVVEPRWQDGLDWFLTPAQTCALGARVHDRWDFLPDAVRSAVADETVLLRKSGGAPGVVAGVWLVDGAAGPHVITIQFAAERQTAVGDATGLMAVGDALAMHASR